MPTALITGASSGIGRAIAEKLAGQGYDLVLVARQKERLDAVAAALRGRVEACAADVSDSAQVDRVVAQALKTFGRIDVLVNAAGSAPSLVTHAVTNEQWRQVIDSNLSSAMYATRAVWPAMERQHAAWKAAHPGQTVARGPASGGCIINISSMATRDPFPGLGVYAIAKIGINMLTLATAREGVEAGIRVFCIAPAAVETPMLRTLVDTKSLPTESIMLPEEIAAVAGAMVDGTMQHASGETLYLQRK